MIDKFIIFIILIILLIIALYYFLNKNNFKKCENYENNFSKNRIVVSMSINKKNIKKITDILNFIDKQNSKNIEFNINIPKNILKEIDDKIIEKLKSEFENINFDNLKNVKVHYLDMDYVNFNNIIPLLNREKRSSTIAIIIDDKELLENLNNDKYIENILNNINITKINDYVFTRNKNLFGNINGTFVIKIDAFLPEIVDIDKQKYNKNQYDIYPKFLNKKIVSI